MLMYLHDEEDYLLVKVSEMNGKEHKQMIVAKQSPQIVVFIMPTYLCRYLQPVGEG